MAQVLATVGGAFLSAFLQVLFDRMASREVVDFFSSSKLRKRLLKKLEITLLSANAVLDDAEEKQITNASVKKWLDELKDAVYDADDLLDEIASKNLMREAEVEVKARALASKVWSFVSDALMSPFEHKLRKVLDRLEMVVMQREVLGLREDIRQRTPRTSMPTTSLVEESGICGREKDKEAVIRLLLSTDQTDRSTCVIAVVGMAGVGKTTLSQLVFNDDKVKQSFELKSWVCISDQFDICKLTRMALEEFSSSKNETENLNQLQLQLKNLLSGKKFLLVLDDVWNEDYNIWNAFQIPFSYGARGSKIVVTTRNEGTASVVRAVSTYSLQKLQDQESWNLFAKHAFDENNFEARPKLEEIGRQIVKKCDGLPLALKTVGSLLRSESDVRKWEVIAESNMWDFAPGRNEILPALLLSYYYLPPLLKRCFAYCSIFPKGSKYDKEQLILLWVAEGLIEQPKDGRTFEEVGNECFCGLVSRSLLQRVSNTKSSFMMHELVNDLARYVAGQSFFSLDGGNACQISSRTRHLSYLRTRYDVASRFKVLHQATRLRTFLPLNMDYMTSNEFFFLTDEVLYHMLPTLTQLRVLSLSHYQKMSTLPSSVGCLKHLRYLNLSYSRSLNRLPDSITALWNLQTLILAYCESLTELPSNMDKLANLRHLDIRETCLSGMPQGMNKLKKLQTLTNFVVAENGGTRIKELGELGNLTGILSIQGLQNVMNYEDAAAVNLQGKRFLKKLVLEWSFDTNNGQTNRINLLDQLQPHSSLEELIIRSYGGRTFPNWVGQDLFSNMLVMHLEFCKHCVSLPPLGQLPSLETLIIRGFDGIKRVGSEFNGKHHMPFQSLKYLEFSEMYSWKEWVSFEDHIYGHTFPCLQELHIRNCPKLSGVLPSHLPSLSALSIEKCPQMISSLPLAPPLRKLNLQDCKKLSGTQPLQYGTELQEMELKSLASLPVSFLPPKMTRLDVKDSHELEIPKHTCHESLQYLNLERSCDSLTCFPLEMFLSLKNLELLEIKHLKSISALEGSLLLHSLTISKCPEFRSFPLGGLAAPCLTSLEINECHLLKSLPQNMQALLPSLRSLKLSSCPELESFPAGGLPSKLVALSISNCNKLIAGRQDWGLHLLCSLRTFVIEQEKGIESFPEVGLLPSSLTSVYIFAFENLKSLDAKALQSLSSLQNLYIGECPRLRSFPKEGQILPASLTTLLIYDMAVNSLDNLGLHDLTCLEDLHIIDCPKLQNMPAKGLPSSLSNLFIYGCPSLQKGCLKKKGKNWPRISHIHCIIIEDVLIT